MAKTPVTPLNMPITVERTDTCDVYRCGNVEMWIERDDPSKEPSFSFNADSPSWAEVRCLYALLLLPAAQREMRATVNERGLGRRDTTAEYAALEALVNTGGMPSAQQLSDFIHADGLASCLWTWACSYAIGSYRADGPIDRFAAVERQRQTEWRAFWNDGEVRTDLQPAWIGADAYQRVRDSLLSVIRIPRPRRKAAV